MKRRAPLLALAAQVFLWGILRAEDSLVLSAQTEILPSTTIPVAETAQAAITILSNQAIKISSFTTPFLEDASVLKSAVSKSVRTGRGDWQTKIIFDILPLALGELQFPSLNIVYRANNRKDQVLLTPPAKAAVINPAGLSLAPQGLRDIKGPVSAGINPWVLILIAGVLLGAAAGFIAWKRKKKVLEIHGPPQPLRPAHEVALEKLELAYQAYRKNLDVKLFYSEISLIFREYLSRRYFLDAMEKTTSEIFAELREKGLDRKLCLGAREILSAGDLVKFAKYIPSEKQIEEDFSRAKAFVETTRPLPAPAEAAAK